ncbi:MAG: hypothetical protein NC254_13285 [bacterium]|nr:hypothetical protein [bacterium]
METEDERNGAAAARRDQMLRFEFYKICKQKIIFLAFGILLLYAAAAVLEIYHPDHWNNIAALEDGKTVNGREGLAVNQSRAEQDASGYSDSWETFLYSYFKLISVFSFFIVVVFSPLFSYETHCGMSAVVHTAPCGKIKCARVKILMSVMITNIAFVIVTLMMAVGFLIRYGMCGYDTSIQIGRFGYFYKSQIPINYLGLSIHYILLSILCVNMILLNVLIISLKSRTMIQALITSLAVLYIFDQTAVYAVIKSEKPFYFLSLFPVNALKITSVVSDFDPVTIFGCQVQWIYLIEIFYLFALGIGFWILCGKVVKRQKYYGE